MGSHQSSALTFEPLLQERIWGGRRLADLYGKKLPSNVTIGESWEIVDRPEAQSIVRDGPFRGKTLHELWTQDRQSIFGDVPDTARFPLILKILDAREKLSLQVHPPEKVAAKLGGEAKTEFWYVAAADPGAELFVGLQDAMTPGQFKGALHSGTVADYVHRIRVKTGDAMFLPAGRLHAVGEGNFLIEIQQNSDTTYRVFDWNRVDAQGRPRQLHIDQALQCIDLNDIRPQPVQTGAEVLLHHDLFEIQKWNLDSPREIALAGEFAIVCCLTGRLRCADVELEAGGFCLIPARSQDRSVKPLKSATSLLRITIPM
jgi:mannose-6-phosphate isomerase